MPKYTCSIVFPFDIYKAYDVILYYFPKQRFSIKSTSKPTTATFERTTDWKAGLDAKDHKELKLKSFPCTLKVSLDSSETERTVILFEYNLILLDREEEMNNEVEGLHKAAQELGISTPNIISQKEEQDRKCVKCIRQIPWDANICPYCGHNYLNKKEK
jgi:ribosomal protein L40E